MCRVPVDQTSGHWTVEHNACANTEAHIGSAPRVNLQLVKQSQWRFVLPLWNACCSEANFSRSSYTQNICYCCRRSCLKVTRAFIIGGCKCCKPLSSPPRSETSHEATPEFHSALEPLRNIACTLYDTMTTCHSFSRPCAFWIKTTPDYYSLLLHLDKWSSLAMCGYWGYREENHDWLDII